MKVIDDERTNSLIVLASAQVTSDIELIVEKLDREQSRPRENIHIYTLKNAVAEDVAKVLGEIPGKGPKDDKQGKRPPLSRDVQISADKATNTLVIVSEPEEYEILEEIIKKLDVVRPMVYVEALIMEARTTKALELGVRWHAGDQFGGGLGDGSGGLALGGFRGTDVSLDLDGPDVPVLPSGFNVGVIGRGITFGDVVFPTISAFVRAVRTDSDFNIISTPQILTLDNEEAMIEVGENIPFVTRVDAPNEVTERAIQSFEYKDVGVTLKITPQISSDDFIRLAVEESVKNVVSSTALGGTVLAPTTTYREAKTTITVKDGETAVIAGLIERSLDRGKTQTPCLGNIPGLGWLFKSVSDQDDKTNLMVFLTPHIVKDAQMGRELYEKKRDSMEREYERVKEEGQPEELRKKSFE
jgi:general secretion pathway protein D